MEHQKVLCVGDSLTLGQVGWSYVDFSSRTVDLINAGRNGDTAASLARRLPRLLRAMPAGSACVIAIGTNDTLLPHMTTQPGWRLLMELRVRLMRCQRDDHAFAGQVRGIVRAVSQAGHGPILLGLPLTEMTDYPEAEHARRSALLRNIADEERFPFVDVAAAMRAIPGAVTSSRRFQWSPTPLARVLDAIRMRANSSQKDALARQRGLTLTCDGIHWTSATARAVASAVDHTLSTQWRPK